MTTRMRRRTLAILAAACLACPLVAGAQSFPQRPIRVIVPFPPGGASDILARAFFADFDKRIGAAIVIENKAGAGAVIGTQAVADAAPDGYTLGFFDVAFAINPGLRAKELPYQTRSFLPLIYVAEATQVFVASTSSGVKTGAEAIAALKAADRKRSFSSAGIGSGSHLAAEQLSQVLKVPYLHVPYKGGAPSNAALAGGEVDFTFATASAIRNFVDAGKAIPLAVASSKRIAVMPDVPTFAELGVKGAEAAVFFGVFAPAGLPAPIAGKLEQEMKAHLETPAVRERLTKLGFDVDGRIGAQFGAFVDGEIGRWQAVISTGNVKVE